MTGNSTIPPCSVVIRAYNEEKHVGRLLEGVFRQTLKDPEIILVDSGSTDATISTASHFPVRIVHIQPDEFSFGRSLNLGISYTTAEIIVIVSAHVYPVYPDWFERLLAPFNYPEVALTYGKQRGDDNARFSEQQVFAGWYPEHSEPRQTHPFCNNANAAIRRSLWEAHPYDETLSGLEDLAWTHWAIGQGYNLSYVAEAEVIHVHHETPRAVYNRYLREAMAFKRIFPQENFRFNEFAQLVVASIASDLWHAAQQKALGKHLASIFWFRWMQFWGTYQGYHQSGPLTEKLRQAFYYPQGFASTQTTFKRKVEPIQYTDA